MVFVAVCCAAGLTPFLPPPAVPARRRGPALVGPAGAGVCVPDLGDRGPVTPRAPSGRASADLARFPIITSVLAVFTYALDGPRSAQGVAAQLPRRLLWFRHLLLRARPLLGFRWRPGVLDWRPHAPPGGLRTLGSPKAPLLLRARLCLDSFSEPAAFPQLLVAALRCAAVFTTLEVPLRKLVGVAAHGPPRVPGDLEDHGRDREADQRVGDRQAERDDDRRWRPPRG